MKSRNLLYGLITSCSCLWISCSLGSICEPGTHSKGDNAGSCVPDSTQECGFRMINCCDEFESMDGILRSNGVVTSGCDLNDEVIKADKGKSHEVNCVDQICEFKFLCDEDRGFFHDDEEETSLGSSNCVRKCKCDLNSDNPLEAESCTQGQLEFCIQNICPVGEELSSKLENQAEYTKVSDIMKDPNNVYCIRNTKDFNNLGQWIKDRNGYIQSQLETIADQKVESPESGANPEKVFLTVYLLNDIDLSGNCSATEGNEYSFENDSGFENCIQNQQTTGNTESVQTWSGFDFENVRFTVFGGVQNRKHIYYSGAKLSHGLLGKIVNSRLENIAVNLNVEGDDAYGILADNIVQSDIINVDVSGSLTNTKPDESQGYDLFSLDYIINNACGTEQIKDAHGIGGFAGKIEASVFKGISLGTMNLTDEPGKTALTSVIAANHYLVGGIAGIVCHSQIIGNEDDDQLNYLVHSVSGLDGTGGVFGLMGYSSAQSMRGEIGSVTGRSFVGGFTGYTDYGSFILDIHHSAGDISGKKFIGGFVGWDNSEMNLIENVTENVEGIGDGSNDGEYIGGFAGYKIFHALNDVTHQVGTVIGKSKVGGLIGHNGSDIIVRKSEVLDKVSGETNVGGLIGHMQSGNVSGVTDSGANVQENTQEINGVIVNEVQGNSQTGGTVGSLSYGMVSNLKSKVNKVSGTSQIGGFVGYFGTGIIEGIDNEVEVIDASASLQPEEDSEHPGNMDFSEKSIGGFVGYMGEGAIVVGATKDEYDGYGNKNTVNEIKANNQCVGGFAGFVKGSISSVYHKISKLRNDYGREMYDTFFWDGYQGTGGFVGCSDQKSIIQHIKTTSGTINAGWYAGGVVGHTNGYFVDIINRTTNVFAKNQFAGGFVGRVSTYGLISNSYSQVDTVFSSVESGGFASEMDGEVTAIRSWVDHVTGDYIIGGTAAACGGRMTDVVSHVNLVERLNCERVNSTGNSSSGGNYAGEPFDCVINDGTKDKISFHYSEEWDYNLKTHFSPATGGFVGFGDGMYDSEYSAIISRVNLIKGGGAGGFMGIYDFRGYSSRNVKFENVSSWGNVEPLGYSVSENKKDALFIADVHGVYDDNKDSLSLTIRNVVAMGHVKDKNGSDVTENYVIGNLGDIVPRLNITKFYVFCLEGNCTDTMLNTNGNSDVIRFMDVSDADQIARQYCAKIQGAPRISASCTDEYPYCQPATGDVSDLLECNLKNVCLCGASRYVEFWDFQGVRPPVTWKMLLRNTPEKYSFDYDYSEDESMDKDVNEGIVDAGIPVFTFRIAEEFGL